MSVAAVFGAAIGAAVGQAAKQVTGGTKSSGSPQGFGAATEQQSTHQTITVQGGDSLGKLALRHLGSISRWSELWAANRDQISNPNLIYPGMVLRLPGTGAAPAPVAPAPTPDVPPAPHTDEPAGFEPLERGHRGPAVLTLQQRLVALRYMTQTELNTGPGIFGPRTESAVRRFQQANGLALTGRLDAATHEALQTATPREASGGFVYPTHSTTITSPFGMRLHPIHGTWRMHRGTDFGAGHGSDVMAVADGTVTFAGNDPDGYGNWLEIEHLDGKRTRYAHLSSFEVTSGPVSQGQVIGKVGSTGASTGPHLHFEVRIGGEAVDPMSYLP